MAGSCLSKHGQLAYSQ